MNHICVIDVCIFVFVYAWIIQSVAYAVKVSGKKIKVTAKKAGEAKITVKTKGKNKKKKKLSKKLTITVKKAIVTKKTVPWYSCDAPGQIKTQNNAQHFNQKKHEQVI